MLPGQEYALNYLCPSFFSFSLTNSTPLQKITPPLSFLVRANPSVNSFTLTISPSCSSGCSENMMMLSQSYFVVSDSFPNSRLFLRISPVTVIDPWLFHSLWHRCCLSTVAENEEVTIKEVADSIVKAIGFQGEYLVCYSICDLFLLFHPRSLIEYEIYIYSLTPAEQTVSSVNRLQMKSFWSLWVGSSSHHLIKVCTIRSLATLHSPSIMGGEIIWMQELRADHSCILPSARHHRKMVRWELWQCQDWRDGLKYGTL